MADHPTSRLVPKRPLTKPATSFGSSVDEKPSEARGTLVLAPPPQPATKKRNKQDSGSVVRQFNSRQEPSPFLDSTYMERRAKALSVMRQPASE
ncbi:hypothetical protein BFW01_g6446 [Lasiodiplodia theobromae]|uniref:uncharacterized protein n=1 Tax=Lasiodiplodia theobromae TaxID=45133 RepID=UPI0015C34746|nr:uncharacterized protein LTHEOB_11251 [Lasiodiplodia theobromae]KAF4537931.1 hypothetical protein LTHEOB_11251 [Lasiodiplodia theobromae]KAF9635551.1 hypothetical protein BFW01_g6446 [Lasiodiplodia theobromae]